jgi:hypothetical protein
MNGSRAMLDMLEHAERHDGVEPAASETLTESFMELDIRKAADGVPGSCERRPMLLHPGV